VDNSLVLLAGGGAVAVLSWLDSAIFFKKGFFVSVSPWGLVKEDAGGLATEDGGVFW
jgi:hypothetical protein